MVSVLAYNHAVRSSAARDSHFRPEPGTGSHEKETERQRETQGDAETETATQKDTEEGGELLRDSKAQRKAHARTAGRRQSIISDVHTDLTRRSGPAVLRHLLRANGQLGHLRPPSRPQHHDVTGRSELPRAESVLAEDTEYRYVMLNVWRNMDREHCVHR